MNCRRSAGFNFNLHIFWYGGGGSGSWLHPGWSTPSSQVCDSEDQDGSAFQWTFGDAGMNCRQRACKVRRRRRGRGGDVDRRGARVEMLAHLGDSLFRTARSGRSQM